MGSRNGAYMRKERFGSAPGFKIRGTLSLVAPISRSVSIASRGSRMPSWSLPVRQARCSSKHPCLRCGVCGSRRPPLARLRSEPISFPRSRFDPPANRSRVPVPETGRNVTTGTVPSTGPGTYRRDFPITPSVITEENPWLPVISTVSTPDQPDDAMNSSVRSPTESKHDWVTLTA